MSAFPPHHTIIDKAHGRLEVRHIWTRTELTGYITFPPAAQVLCIQRNTTEIVTQKELLMAQVIELDVVTQLLIEKGIISREQFFDKLKGGSGT